MNWLIWVGGFGLWCRAWVKLIDFSYTPGSYKTNPDAFHGGLWFFLSLLFTWIWICWKWIS